MKPASEDPLPRTTGWEPEEDQVLSACIAKYGVGNYKAIKTNPGFTRAISTSSASAGLGVSFFFFLALVSFGLNFVRALWYKALSLDVKPSLRNFSTRSGMNFCRLEMGSQDGSSNPIERDT